MTGMLLCVCSFLSAAAAWWIGMSFVRAKRKDCFLSAGLMGLSWAMGTALVHWLEADAYLVPVGLVIFLMASLMIPFTLRMRTADALLVFLIAQCANALFLFLCGWAVETSVLALLLPGAIWGGSLFLTWCLRERFPEGDWQESYTEPGRMAIHLWQAYLIPALACVLMTLAAFVIEPAAWPEALLWGVMGGCLFWAGLLLVIFMSAYKRERLAVLVEQQYRGEMQSFLNVIRSQRHDYNFHVQTIAALIREENWAACAKYVDALEADAVKMNAVLPIQDPAISAMIHNFQLLAAREGIELHLDIQNDLSLIATNVYETNKIISNLLQNAIDETRGHRDKSYGIWLTILKRGEYCVIHVANRVENADFSARELGRLYQHGYTTKPGHDGVGLSSVRTLVERYRGLIYTRTEDDVIHFVAKVPINYSKWSEDSAEEGQE